MLFSLSVALTIFLCQWWSTDTNCFNGDWLTPFFSLSLVVDWHCFFLCQWWLTDTVSTLSVVVDWHCFFSVSDGWLTLTVFFCSVVADTAGSDQQQVRGSACHEHLQLPQRHPPAVDDLPSHQAADGDGHRVLRCHVSLRILGPFCSAAFCLSACVSQCFVCVSQCFVCVSLGLYRPCAVGLCLTTFCKHDA